jgi:hypothetical protein
MDMEVPIRPAVAAFNGNESPTTTTFVISSAKAIRYIVDLLIR